MFKFLLMLIGLVIIGCDSNTNTKPQQAPSLAMSFERVNTNQVKVLVNINPGIASLAGFSKNLSSLALTAEYGSLQNIVLNPYTKQFEALLIPPDIDETPNANGDIWSGEILVTASYQDPGNLLDLQIARRVLIVPSVYYNLGQPESVPGLVNTLGVEDSPQVSPDGEYLIVGTYSPVDIAYCQVNGSSLYDAPACNKNFYDFSGVERPTPFGASRLIDNNTIDHAIPGIGYIPTTGSPATPPVNSYGFKRQQDGSYAEPFVIGVDSGGYTSQATYGFTFDFTNPSNPGVFYSFNDLGDNPDSLTDIYYSPVTLGVPNVFARYSSGVLINFTSVKVPIDGTSVCDAQYCEYGNPHITSDRLWFDNERGTDDLFYVDVVRDNAGQIISYSSPEKVAISIPGRGEAMPYMDGQTLYYMCDTNICRSTLITGQDPALLSSWLPEEVLMNGATSLSSAMNAGRDGRMLAVSEPSIANIKRNGVAEKWLYFGYIMQAHYGSGTNDFGGNWNVGRVRLY